MNLMNPWTLGTYDVGDSKESSFISAPVMLGISGGELMWRRVLFSTKCSLLHESISTWHYDGCLNYYPCLHWI